MATRWWRTGGQIGPNSLGYVRRLMSTQTATETLKRTLLGFNLYLEFASQVAPGTDYQQSLTWGVRRVPEGATPGADQGPVSFLGQDWIITGMVPPVLENVWYTNDGQPFVSRVRWSTSQAWIESEAQRRPLSGVGSDWWFFAERSGGGGLAEPNFVFGQFYSLQLFET